MKALRQKRHRRSPYPSDAGPTSRTFTAGRTKSTAEGMTHDGARQGG
jgi:hypothetical protein